MTVPTCIGNSQGVPEPDRELNREHPWRYRRSLGRAAHRVLEAHRRDRHRDGRQGRRVLSAPGLRPDPAGACRDATPSRCRLPRPQDRPHRRRDARAVAGRSGNRRCHRRRATARPRSVDGWLEAADARPASSQSRGLEMDGAPSRAAPVSVAFTALWLHGAPGGSGRFRQGVGLSDTGHPVRAVKQRLFGRLFWRSERATSSQREAQWGRARWSG